ncbi:YraN family protein [candidate division KSB1 bacterium]|nr:YraN family protein [candidate division KSB1 bacterium]RQW07924.1 MAG: YraN family protein [candidate division KSB1 bacterium]
MSARQNIGRTGEEMAADHLRRHGYVIKARNYRLRNGEIDIIAQKDAVLVFIEVKTARSSAFGAPATWVDERKQRRIGRAAARYLADNEIEDVDCRFDVIAIDLTAPPHIEHIEDAFWLEE